MKNVIYLPLDERPCNYNFAGFLTENNSEINLIRPSLSVLGDKKTPANFNGLFDFLIENCKTADYLILSIDMLLYGGIVPSRLHHDSAELLKSRLEIINKIKKINGKIKIYAFSLIMRCPCYSSSDEEPDYYETCGEELFLYGQNEHKRLLNKITDAEYQKTKEDLLSKCGNYLDDFTSRRKTNLEMVINALSLVGREIDYFIIPQDDSNPIGFTAMDQLKVKSFIKDNNLKVDIYPGADEVGMTLLAHTLIDIKGISPKIYPIYPKEQCKNVIPTFEDREVYKSIAFQIENAGGTLCENYNDADILLYCNLPVGEMKNTMFQFGPSYDKRDLPKFIEKIVKDVNDDKKVAIADLAYLNGGDILLTKTIAEKIDFFKLAGYAGWNTSSNSLGTVICQSLFFYFFGQTKTHERFTAERLFEDVAYCSKVRKNVVDNDLDKINCNYLKIDGVRGSISKIIQDKINRFMEENFKPIYDKFYILDCYMPWNRTFEVGLIIKERL